MLKAHILYTLRKYTCSLGIKPMTCALISQCFTTWPTETLLVIIQEGQKFKTTFTSSAWDWKHNSISHGLTPFIGSKVSSQEKEKVVVSAEFNLLKATDAFWYIIHNTDIVMYYKQKLLAYLQCICSVYLETMLFHKYMSFLLYSRHTVTAVVVHCGGWYRTAQL